MVFLKTMEFVTVTFLVFFFAWQLILPLLQGKKPFGAFRKKK